MSRCLADFSTWGSEYPLQRSPCPALASPRLSPVTPTWCSHTPTCCLGHTGSRLRLPDFVSETGTSTHTTLPILPMPQNLHTPPIPIFLQWHLPWNTSLKAKSICTSYFPFLLSFFLVYWTLSSILLSPLKCKFWEFPGNPMQWLCTTTATSAFNDFGFHCWGSRVQPLDLGNQEPTSCVVWPI